MDYVKNKLKRTFNPESMNDAECIICKKNHLSTCRYCFSLVLIRTLRELNFTEDLIDGFGYNPLYGEVSLETGSITDIEELKMIAR
jgi:hypothetical protein